MARRKMNLAIPSASGEMTLNITSLMDVLTIVLIFLIFNFDSNKQDEFTPPEDFNLPVSNAQRPLEGALKISIGPEEIRLEDQKITGLKKNKPSSKVVNKDNHIVPLLKALKQEKSRRESESQAQGDLGKDDVAYIEAGQKTPYSLIDQVLKTAAGAGIVKFKLAVMQKE